MNRTFCGKWLRSATIFVATAVLCNRDSYGDGGQALTYLKSVADQYHSSFFVYSDFCAGGNHGTPSGWMGDTNALQYGANWTNATDIGRTCIRVRFTAGTDNWTALYFLSQPSNWGTIPGGGYDLSGSTKVAFDAWGAQGGERVEFFFGGVTSGPYGDSCGQKVSTGYVTLSSAKQRFEIPVPNGVSMTNVVGLFGFAVNAPNNPWGATFYLDRIAYDKPRLSGRRFLNSYRTLYRQEPDKYLHNASFIYDDALTLMACLAAGTPEGQLRAQSIADTFLFCLNHDRYYTNVLRNAYQSGDIRDSLTGKARLPGWWDEATQSWYEDSYQVSTFTGNIGWAMIALLTYYQNTGGGAAYLEAVKVLGDWVETNTRDARGNGGYTGGYSGWEPSPTNLLWKSSEHNINLYVAFRRLYDATGDGTYLTRSQHAYNFVTSMWNEAGSHFWTGTLEDGVTPDTDPNHIPADVQCWAVMALSNDWSALTWVTNNCSLTCHGFNGFDFNADRDGIWPEGTAHMVVALDLCGFTNAASYYLAELDRIQASASNGNGKGIVSACHDSVTTGLDWKYFNRLHVGATAWYVMACLRYNPYWGTFNHNPSGKRASLDFDGDGRTDPAIFDADTGRIAVRTSLLGAFLTNRVGHATWVPAAADYDGDGKADYSWFIPSTQIWRIYPSTSNYAEQMPRVQIGGTDDVPVPADFDGDRQADLAVFRRATGKLWVRYSSLHYTNLVATDIGQPSWLPTVGDYDGAGQADYSWFIPSTAVWRIYPSTSNYAEQLPRVTLGGNSDVPLPGTDFDGDGRADLAVFRRATGKIWVRYSSLDYTNLVSSAMGMPTWLPTVGDYDGDGRTDYSWFIPATQNWRVYESSSAYAERLPRVSFGGANDWPLATPLLGW